MLCQDDVAPGEFLLVQCACQLFFGLGTSTHVCHDQLLIIISSSGMLAMSNEDTLTLKPIVKGSLALAVNHSNMK